jgi:ABC-type transporter Mla subunit MlaD
LLRVLKGVWRLPVLMDNQRRFEAYALARQQDIADHVNQLARQRGEQLYIIVEDMAETLVMLAEELHSASAQFAETSEKTATLLESSAKLDDKLNEIVAASTRLAAQR